MEKINRRDFIGNSLLAVAAATGAITGLTSGMSLDINRKKNPAEKMSVGLVTYMWGSDWDINTLIANCKKTQMSAVELRVEHAHKVSPALSADERKAVKKLFNKSGIKLLGFGTNYDFHSPDKETVRKNIEGAKEYLLLSRDCGSSGVKVKPNDLPKNVSQEQTVAQIAQALNELGKFASDIGQEIRLEVHGGCAKIPIMKAIMDQVTEKSVGLCWNCNREDLEGDGLATNFASIRNRFGRTMHIRHLANTSYPTKELFDLLWASQYDGYLLIEEGNVPSADERIEKMKQSVETLSKWKKEAK
ncbi:MAG: sugar phosphate isomerase/epimerase [Tannerella sp.]|jgi:sugar phosphate isomerase/epimerase|nr:sugar phosphate isomerase/epimerase [Tannerella sp.]